MPRNDEPSKAATHESPDMRAIALVGETLAPLFLSEPAADGARGVALALAGLDPSQAGAQWPFVDDEQAAGALAQVTSGLAAGPDDKGLAREYRRLFVGPAALPAPPWGSVYTDREHVLFGATTLELRLWMRVNGVARTSDERTPEDHIGLLLALMAYLARERPELVDEFLRVHVLTWAPDYLGRLEGVAAHDLYRGLARLARLSLEGIAERRGIRADPLPARG